MKKIFLALIAALCSMSINAQVMEILKDGKVVATYTADQADQVVFKESTTPEPIGHEYVDLGLSVKWATCNVGAEKPEDYGDYFAWGETEPKSTYNLDTYFDSNYDEYATFGTKTQLDPEDDAAHVNWGGDWRMPTKAETDELRSNCTWTWTIQNGVNGYKVTSKVNGNSLFLPAAGYRKDSSLYHVGSEGEYWSSSLYSSFSVNAYCLFFNSSLVDNGSFTRYEGQSVRAVCP